MVKEPNRAPNACPFREMKRKKAARSPAPAAAAEVNEHPAPQRLPYDEQQGAEQDSRGADHHKGELPRLQWTDDGQRHRP
jgi:hypothetical protein